MAETTNKVPVKTEKTPASAQARRPFPALSPRNRVACTRTSLADARISVARSRGRAKAGFGAIPTVALTETDKAYEIISQLPGGMDEKNIEVTFARWCSDDQGRRSRRKERRKRKAITCVSAAPAHSSAPFGCPRASFKKGVLACRRVQRHAGLKERSPSEPVDPFLSEGHE